jgi:hypothetical protein
MGIEPTPDAETPKVGSCPSAQRLTVALSGMQATGVEELKICSRSESMEEALRVDSGAQPTESRQSYPSPQVRFSRERPGVQRWLQGTSQRQTNWQSGRA